MKPKPKTVRAWCFAWTYEPEKGARRALLIIKERTRKDAVASRRVFIDCGRAVGPVVRIEAPAPKERKR